MQQASALAKCRVGVGPAPVQRCHADAGANAKALLAVHVTVLIHGVAELLGHVLGFIQRAVLQDGRELVATQACHGVAAAHACLKPTCHFTQHLIARCMAAVIIDELEAVQVERQQRVVAAVAAGALQRAVQALAELRPVDEPGQPVVAGTPADLIELAALLGDVPEDQHCPQHPALGISNGGNRVIHGAGLAVSAQQHGAGRQPGGAARAEAELHGIFERLPVFLSLRHEDTAGRLALGLGRRPPGEPLGHGVEPGDAAQGVGREYGVCNGLQRHFEQLSLLLQLLAQPARLAHVPAHARQAQRPPGAVTQHAARTSQHVDATVRPAHPPFALQLRPTTQRRSRRPAYGLAVLRVQALPPARHADPLAVRRIAMQPPHDVVPGELPIAQIQVPHADAAAVRGQSQALQRALELGAHLGRLGHVQHHDAHPVAGLVFVAAAHHAQHAPRSSARKAGVTGQLHVPAEAFAGGALQGGVQHR